MQSEPKLPSSLGCQCPPGVLAKGSLSLHGATEGLAG